MDQKTSRRGFFGMLAGMAAAVAGLGSRPAKASVWDNPTTWRGLPFKVVNELPAKSRVTLRYSESFYAATNDQLIRLYGPRTIIRMPLWSSDGKHIGERVDMTFDA
jgi:hypothetical protein